MAALEWGADLLFLGIYHDKVFISRVYEPKELYHFDVADVRGQWRYPAGIAAIGILLQHTGRCLQHIGIYSQGLYSLWGL